MNREAKILTYVNDWLGGFYDSHNKDRSVMVERTVESTLAYHDIAETPANVRNYSEAFESLVKAGKLEVRRNIYTDAWMFQTPDTDD